MIEPGSRLGHYEIVSALGRGGMGEVWRARDTKLGREVAIKTLPNEFANDTDRLARFDREAKLLAALNHSNIAGIYGFEQDGDTRFLALELVEGDTLADRIQRGPLQVDEALELALQITEALEAAHDKGVIHRDLKPANIKITPEGKVKVLDFGLAKAFVGEATDTNLSQSPTLSMAATQQGIILGTASYMSPEQAKGRATDKRTDIWAFGCVLFEMLAGRPVFQAEDVSTILARVLDREPDFTLLPSNVHPRLLEILRRCLTKDVSARFRDIGDVAFELKRVAEEPSAAAMSDRNPSRGISPFAVGAVAAVTLLIGWLGGGRFGSGTEFPPWARGPVFLSFGPPEGTLFDASYDDPFAVSPDGSTVAFVAVSFDGVRQLWVRPLNASGSRPLPGTEGARSPFWSPDSSEVAFYAPGALKRVSVSGGEPSVVARISPGRFSHPTSGAWSGNGTILFKSGPLETAFERVSLQGGSGPPATTLGTEDGGHRFASFLEDGERFVYRASRGTRATWLLGSLAASDPQELKPMAGTAGSGQYVPAFLLYVDDETLWAEGFDTRRGVLAGNPRRLVEDIPVSGPSRSPFSASTNGVLAYQRNAAGYDTVFEWYDRNGQSLGTAVEAAGRYRGFDISFDGSRLVYGRVAPDGTVNVRIRNLERGDDVPRSFHDVAQHPVWSPDASRVAFSSTGDSDDSPPNLHFDVVARDDGPERLVQAPKIVHTASGWTPEDDAILYDVRQLDGTTDVYAYWLEDGREESLAINSEFDEWGAVVSSDSRWVAYVTSRSGQEDVWVARFPSGEDRQPVSVGGGFEPQWREDGTELYFVSSDGVLTAAAMDSSGDELRVGTLTPLFPLGRAVGLLEPGVGTYSATADGQRFLVAVQAETPQAPIEVILNWPALLLE